jgi:hypothetical protein
MRTVYIYSMMYGLACIHTLMWSHTSIKITQFILGLVLWMLVGVSGMGSDKRNVCGEKITCLSVIDLGIVPVLVER